MTHFGIATWTPLDIKVSHGTQAAEVLPVIFRTDQRSKKCRQYYLLDAADVLGDVTSIAKFMNRLKTLS